MKQLINTNADISYHSLSRVTVFHNLLRKSRFAYTEELPFYICNFSFVPSCICMRPIHYRLDDQVLSLFRASFREKSKVNRCFVLQNFRRAKKSGIIFSATESTFSSDSRQSMKRRITAKHLTQNPVLCRQKSSFSLLDSSIKRRVTARWLVIKATNRARHFSSHVVFDPLLVI